MIKLLLTLMGGVAYWFCGQGIVHKIWRPISVSLLSLIMLKVVGVRMKRLVWLVTWMLMWASLTTYYKWGGQEDVELHNWIFCGLFYGMAALPAAFTTRRWKGFVSRIVALIGMVWLFSDQGIVRGVVWQEMGRGMLYVGTLAFFRRRDEEYILDSDVV